MHTDCVPEIVSNCFRNAVCPNSSFFGNGPNTVSESTASNTELSEFFGPHRAPGRELSEFLSAYDLCQSEVTEFFAELTEFAAELSQSSLPKQYSRNSIPPAFRPLPVFAKGGKFLLVTLGEGFGFGSGRWWGRGFPVEHQRKGECQEWKSRLNMKFWAGYRADVRAEIRADAVRKLSPHRSERRKIKLFALTSRTRRRGRP